MRGIDPPAEGETQGFSRTHKVMLVEGKWEGEMATGEAR